ncbi:hypothetical protein [Deinococcus sp. Marseille-Q6407]|uniref:hypothetical protein n=1 Tax=Deinococcus sp. Marseille-Q6407 TaxID=2969223 RepID=UPI0021C00080|nr:hypothetical protein [Deinococcus sp. Marseille-Q6407]
MRAEDWLEELVQLYEYRVEDLSFGRSPRGDRRSFQELRETLLFSDGLDGPARSRLMQAERQFRELQRQGRVHFAAVQRPRPQSRPAADPAGVLRRLSDRLWEADARRWVFAQLWAARCEPRLLPLRALATIAENLQRQQHRQAPRPLITLEEALDSGLAGPQQTDTLTAALLPLIMTAAGRQLLARGARGLRDRALTAAPVPSGMTGAPLPAPGWAEEQQQLERTAAVLEQLLVNWPFHSPAPAEPDWLTPAEQESASAGGRLLALDLSGLDETPRQVQWRGLTLELCCSGNDVKLKLSASGEAAEEQLQLKRELPAELRLWSFELAGQLIHAVLEDDLLLLRSERAAPHGLQTLAGRARLSLFLARPQQAYAAMRLARAAALILRGRPLTGTDLSAATNAARYTAALPAQLGQLAGRGLEALLVLSTHLSAGQRSRQLQEAALAVGLSAAEGRLLAELLGTAALPDLIFDPEVLEAGGFPAYRTFTLLQRPAEGRALSVPGQPVQLLAEGNELSAQLQGQTQEQPVQPLDDLLIWPLPQAGLALVQHEGQLAQATLAYEQAAPSGAFASAKASR